MGLWLNATEREGKTERTEKPIKALLVLDFVVRFADNKKNIQ